MKGLSHSEGNVEKAISGVPALAQREVVSLQRWDAGLIPGAAMSGSQLQLGSDPSWPWGLHMPWSSQKRKKERKPRFILNCAGVPVVAQWEQA